MILLPRAIDFDILGFRTTAVEDMRKLGAIKPARSAPEC